MEALQRFLNRLWVFVLCGVLLSAYGYQFIKGENPCPLCVLQRLGMIGIATAILMNLRFGIKTEHYGLSIITAILGFFVSLRQIALHVCPQFPTFGQPVMGFDLYVWAYIVFICSIFAAAVLMIILGFTGHEDVPPKWCKWDQLAFSLTALIALANMLTTFSQCGFEFCRG